MPKEKKQLNSEALLQANKTLSRKLEKAEKDLWDFQILKEKHRTGGEFFGERDRKIGLTN